MTAPSSTNEEGWMNVSLMVSAFVIGKIAAYGIRHILQERGSRIRIESSPEVSVEIDGEPLGHTPLEFSILHRAIRIVVARDFYQRCAAVGAETPAG